MTPAGLNPQSSFVRYRWLKRILLICGSAVVFLVLLRLWWGAYAHRRWQAQIERIRASGAPVRPEDLNSTVPVADDNNAALALIRATESLTFSDTSEQEIIDGYFEWGELTPAQWDQIAAFKQRHVSALALVRQARDVTGADWGVRFQSPMYAMPPVTVLRHQRQLAKALCAIARQQHRAGNGAEALDIIVDIIRQADVVDELRSNIGHLVAMGLYSLAMSALESSLPDLQVGAAPAASRAQLQHVLQLLLDENHFQDGLRRALLSHRVEFVDCVEVLASSFDKYYRALFRPLFEMNGANHLEQLNILILASEKPTFPEFQALARPLEQKRETPNINFLPYILHQTGYSNTIPMIILHYRHLTARRLALVALAIKLYEVDHGAMPDTLERLVPQYLAELPIDPLSVRGDSFIYRSKIETLILYSVGENGVDDGGLVWDARKKRYDRRNLDFVFLLDGELPDAPGAVN